MIGPGLLDHLAIGPVGVAAVDQARPALLRRLGRLAGEHGIERLEGHGGHGDQHLHQVGAALDAAQRPDEPLTIGLSSNLIDGWKQGIPLIKEGGKIMLYVPGNLAYKDDPTRPGGPQATLIFEVELVKTVPATAAAATPLPTLPDQQ